jgi:tetratricopeptide (TPR) repeat protein
MNIGFIVSLIFTIIFGLVSIVSFVYGIMQNKKAKNAEKEIIEIRQAMESYQYLKNKAFEYYSRGQYEKSLDVFNKYLLNNNDDKEWHDIINQIFKKETIKIFYPVFPLNESEFPTVSVLIQIYISFEEKLSKSSPYPELLKTLYMNYCKNFQKERPLLGFIVSLIEKDWNQTKKYVQGISTHSVKEIDEAFKQYIITYLNNKLGITDDGFTDDIEF